MQHQVPAILPPSARTRPGLSAVSVPRAALATRKLRAANPGANVWPIAIVRQLRHVEKEDALTHASVNAVAMRSAKSSLTMHSAPVLNVPLVIPGLNADNCNALRTTNVQREGPVSITNASTLANCPESVDRMHSVQHWEELPYVLVSLDSPVILRLAARQSWFAEGKTIVRPT